MLKNKLEKSISESHREYLDLDTDEEEFGKQETPEPEDEAELEPDKPSFTQDELKTMINQVIDLTTLPLLKNSDWNEDCKKIITEYFCEPTHTVLTIFFEQCILKAALDFPHKTDSGLIYFLRFPWQIYDAQNFLSTVTFGHINYKIEFTIMSYMNYIFAPNIFDSDELIDTSKNDIFENTHQLLMSLINVVYSPIGLTVLYIPTKSKEIEFDLEKNENDTLDEHTLKMGRLERISQAWIMQLQKALCNSFYVNEKYENTIADELGFWIKKFTNLKQLLEQLSNKNLILILQKLQEENSPSAKKIKKLKIEIMKTLNDTKINLKHANNLLRKSGILKKPSDITKHSIDILHQIKFISKNSDYYNSINGVDKLCRTFSMQVIQNYRNHINVNDLFEKGTFLIKQQLETCIDSCKKYRQSYNQIIDKETDWNAIKNNVFKYIIIFEERCQDIVEICDFMAVFAKVSEVCPLSRGPKAKCNELLFQQINLLFCELLKKISKEFKFALDVTSVRWYRCMHHFKQEKNKLEHKIEFLASQIFKEDVHNTCDAIDMIHTMLEFKHNSSLKKLLTRLWMKTWRMFIQEIKIGTKITKLKIGDIPTEKDIKQVHPNKIHNIVSLCTKMSEINVRIIEYCEISVEEVKKMWEVSRKLSN